MVFSWGWAVYCIFVWSHAMERKITDNNSNTLNSRYAKQEGVIHPADYNVHKTESETNYQIKSQSEPRRPNARRFSCPRTRRFVHHDFLNHETTITGMLIGFLLRTTLHNFSQLFKINNTIFNWIFLSIMERKMWINGT